MACADAKATLTAEECIGACKHRIANITKIDLSYFFFNKYHATQACLLDYK